MTEGNSVGNFDDKDQGDVVGAANAPAGDEDDAKAKFLNGGKRMEDDATVDIRMAPSAAPFTGLSKEELEKYANDPFWNRLRLVLFVLFWVGWLVMLVAAIVIIVMAPRCPYRPDLKWYHTDVVYEVSPRSLFDSDGDGIGDIRGISSKLGYFERLNVKTLWLHSIYRGAFNDSGYGLTNHTQISPVFGDEGDLAAIIKTFKNKGMHLILDFIPNHTHKKHQWFEASRQTSSHYGDYYVWADGSSGKPPNNWQNLNNQSAWNFDQMRKQYYLATIHKDLPDLNLRNADVQKELKQILKHWFGMGVHGFYIQDVQLLMEPNDTASNDVLLPIEQGETLELLKEWRAVADSYSNKPGFERLLFTSLEVKDANETQAYYGDSKGSALNFVAATNLMTLDQMCAGLCMEKAVSIAFSDDTDNWKAWLVGDRNTKRLGSRMTSNLIAIYTLQLLLPGSAFTYYGDEIGMTDSVLSNEIKDLLYSEDPTHPEVQHYVHRSPMLWNNSKNAGFTSGQPWFPVLQNYKEINIASQLAHNNLVKYPSLEAFSDLAQLRTNFSFQWGKTTPSFSNGLFSFVRKAEGFPGYLVAINFGNSSYTCNYYYDYAGVVPESVQVVFHSLPSDNEEFKVGSKINLKEASVILYPGEAVVLKFL